MRMMPAGLFLGSLTPSPSPKERGVIRLEGVVRETREEGKRCSRAAPNPTSWIQKGRGKRERKGRRRRKIEEKDGKKERKRREKRGFLQKNRILQIFVGII